MGLARSFFMFDSQNYTPSVEVGVMRRQVAKSSIIEDSEVY